MPNTHSDHFRKNSTLRLPKLTGYFFILIPSLTNISQVFFLIFYFIKIWHASDCRETHFISNKVQGVWMTCSKFMSDIWIATAYFMLFSCFCYLGKKMSEFFIIYILLHKLIYLSFSPVSIDVHLEWKTLSLNRFYHFLTPSRRHFRLKSTMVKIWQFVRLQM